MRAVLPLPTPLASFDADDRLEFCNRAYRRMIGVPDSVDVPRGERFERLLELWLRRLAFASETERVAFRTARLQQRSWPSCEYDATTLEGRRLHIIDQRDDHGGVTTIATDVTSQERASEELRRASVAGDTAGRPQSTFLRALIPALRNPLAPLLGFAELMLREGGQPLDERQYKRARHILAAAESLRLLIDDVDELALLDDGEVSIRPTRIDVLELLQRVRNLLSQAASRAEVHLSVATAPVPSPLADPTQLSKVLIEFASNAIQYSRPRGSVTFAAAARAEHVRLSVADTGPGVPVEKQHELFRPFARAGRGSSGVQGTGLGLAICRRRAERMGAEVGFCHLLGGGAEFWIDLPLASRMTPS